MSRAPDQVELEVRPLMRGDLSALVALEREIFGPDAWSKDLLAEEIESPWSTYLGVFEGESLIAYGGIKGDLEGDLIEVARQRGMRELFLEVRASNQAARNLYRSEGFGELARIPSYYRYPTEDAVAMRLEVTSPK